MIIISVTIIIPPKKLKISSIDPDESETTSEKVIQVNLSDSYYIKLCKTISSYSPIENINICHFSDLFIDIKGYIRQFNRFWVLDYLQLIIIREIHDQIAIGYLGYQKTMSFIIQNYY